MKTINIIRCAYGSIIQHRYVQLPINARMREAWEQEWQAVDVDGKTQKKTFMAAAARLGVGVFASAPLLEGELLKDEALRVSHHLPYTRTHPYILGPDPSIIKRRLEQCLINHCGSNAARSSLELG